MRSFYILLKNELKLNIRNMNMIIFAVIMPIIVLAIIGLIYNHNPAYDGAQYTFIEQSISGLCAISICAGGLMGLPLVVSEYRERKILKRFKVTPVSPVKLLAVEFTIYVIYSFISLISIIVLANLFWGAALRGNEIVFAASWLLTLISTLSIGMMVGGIAKNAKSASVISCVMYFPMLIFSGATLPFEVLPDIIQKIVSVFPIVQGISLMKTTFLGLPPENIALSLLSMGAVTIICSVVAIKCFRWE